jgi:hypothetical protein
MAFDLLATMRINDRMTDKIRNIGKETERLKRQTDSLTGINRQVCSKDELQCGLRNLFVIGHDFARSKNVGGYRWDWRSCCGDRSCGRNLEANNGKFERRVRPRAK